MGLTPSNGDSFPEPVPSRGGRPGYCLTRFLILGLLGLVYLVAFFCLA